MACSYDMEGPVSIQAICRHMLSALVTIGRLDCIISSEVDLEMIWCRILFVIGNGTHSPTHFATSKLVAVGFGLFEMVILDQSNPCQLEAALAIWPLQKGQPMERGRG